MHDKFVLTGALLAQWEDEAEYSDLLARLDENSMEYHFVVDSWEHNYDGHLVDDYREWANGIPSIFT